MGLSVLAQGWGMETIPVDEVAPLIEHLSWITHIGVVWSFLAAVGFTVQIIGTASLSRRVPALCLASLQSIGATVALSIAIAIQGAILILGSLTVVSIPSRSRSAK